MRLLSTERRWTSPSSPSRASQPCSSRLSRAPPRCSRLRRLPLCPCPLRAPPHFVAPSGAFRSSRPAGPALDSSSCRFLQTLPSLRIFAKFSPLVQASAKYHFLFSLRPCAPFAVALWLLNFSCLRSSLSVRQAHRLVGTALPCLVGLLFFKNLQQTNEIEQQNQKNGNLVS